MNLAPVLFYFFAVIAVVSALMMLTRKTALGAAISLIACFLAFSGLYVLLDAPFVAVMQIAVYAGAIMMLIIFVIMTVDTDAEALRIKRGAVLAAIISALLVAGGFAVYALALHSEKAFPQAQPIYGSISAVGLRLFTKHVLNFEMLSLLLLIAVVGAIVLTKKSKKICGK